MTRAPSAAWNPPERQHDNVNRTLRWGASHESHLCQFGLRLSPRRQLRPTRVATRLCDKYESNELAITASYGNCTYQLVISHARQVPRSSSDTLWRFLWTVRALIESGYARRLQPRVPERRSKTRHLRPGQTRGHLAAAPHGPTEQRFARHTRLENVQRRGRQTCRSSQVARSRRRQQTRHRARMAWAAASGTSLGPAISIHMHTRASG
jgi:hypothetical protein